MVHGPDESHRPSGTRTAHYWRLAAGGGLFAFVGVDAETGVTVTTISAALMQISWLVAEQDTVRRLFPSPGCSRH
jgi:hypothetical protein